MWNLMNKIVTVNLSLVMGRQLCENVMEARDLPLGKCTSGCFQVF